MAKAAIAGAAPACNIVVLYEGEIVSRDEAWVRKLPKYFLGPSEPCANGHVAQRGTGNARCSECVRLRSLKLRQSKPGWTPPRAKLPDEEIKRREKKRKRKYRALKAAEIVAYTLQWRKDNPERHSQNSRANAHRRRTAVGKFTRKDIVRLRTLQKMKCAECRCSIRVNYHVDHIVPIILGGTNFPNNLQLLCPACNHRKHAKHPIDWARENGRLL